GTKSIADPSLLARVFNRLGTIFYLQLLKHVVYMVLDGRNRKTKSIGDLFVRKPDRNHSQDLDLPKREIEGGDPFLPSPLDGQIRQSGKHGKGYLRRTKRSSFGYSVNDFHQIV